MQNTFLFKFKNMESGITIENIWHDEDMYELKISSSDGGSIFVFKIYVDYDTFDKTISELDSFKTQIYGGIYDIEFGSFGPEYAGGAFLARLHFQDRGKIHVSIRAQSEFGYFGMKTIASEAKLYFITVPVLLDNFITELKSLNNGNRTKASLRGEATRQLG